MLRVSLTVALLSAAAALRVPPPGLKPTSVIEKGKTAVVAGALSAMLLASPVTASPTTDAAVDLADAAYPIIQSLQAKTVGPLAGKVVSLGLSGNPKEIIKAIDLGLDAFLSADSGKFIGTVKALKSATAEAAGSGSCNLICMPSVASAEKVAAAAADALATADAGKVKAFVNQAITTAKSGDAMQLVGILADGGKFASSLNPGDVAAATSAALELGKATGAL